MKLRKIRVKGTEIIAVSEKFRSKIIRFRNASQSQRVFAWVQKHSGIELEYEDTTRGVYKLTNTEKTVDEGEVYSISGKKLRMEHGDYPFPRTYFVETTIDRTDSFFIPEYQKLDDYMKRFIEAKDFYKQENLLYKCGVFCYGPPGNGKTTYLRYLINHNILPEDTTYVWCRGIPSLEVIKAFKEIESLKVFIFEELTNSVDNNPYYVQQFLDFMDGEHSLPNSIYFATTNHPEKLPTNIIQRPGRFDFIMEFDNPNDVTREIILKKYFKDTFTEDLIELTRGLSNAEIRETFLLSRIHQLTPSQAVKKLKDHQEFVRRGFEKYGKMGIIDED